MIEEVKKDEGWVTPSKPSFVKLEPGQSITGIYMGRLQTQYGDAYRLLGANGVEQALGGNRVQLDRLMNEIEDMPEKFKLKEIRGHKLEVMRGKNVISAGGRRVAQYGARHVKDFCPKCGTAVLDIGDDQISDDDIPF